MTWLRMAHLAANIRRLRHTTLALITLVGGLTLSPASAQQPFAQLRTPSGVATDLAGNVFVVSDAVTTTLLTKFDESGVPLLQASLGSWTVGAFTNSHLSVDPGTGELLLLTPQGVVFAVRPDTLEPRVLVDLGTLPSSDEAVFDVLTGVFRPLALGPPVSFHDFAVRRLDNGRLDLFISASSGAVGGFPFVLRVRFVARNPAIVDAIVFSSGATSGTLDGRSGIAVNAQGMVVTTMAFPTPIGFTNGLVAFGANFPEDATLPPQFALRGPDGAPRDLTSTGMTTDSAGNFYSATSEVGLSACGVSGSGSLVFLPASLNTLLCLPSGLVLARPEDVAVSPEGNTVYLTDSGGNLVLSFPPAQPLPTTGGAGPITTTDWERRPRRGMPVWP